MRKPTILCVDNEPSGLTGRESLLRQHGYDVVATTSARESLDLLEEVDVDAVILEYRMPEMMGDAVAERMKQLRPEVPIMMLSAQDCLPPATLHAAASFLSKSAPPDQFVDAVHDMVSAGSPFFRRWLQNWKRRLSA
ncbi:MAG TPA: response regulator [Terriglobales bacterium]|nr:response regulator [Terriglobales bacterium]